MDGEIACERTFLLVAVAGLGVLGCEEGVLGPCALSLGGRVPASA